MGDTLRIGRHFGVTFMRTLRIPDDGQEYPLPPGLDAFPIRRVADYATRVPASWRQHGGVFIPMYQREALWLDFDGHYWHPVATKIAVGKVNALSGKPWTEKLTAVKQDYMVVPDQPWLDGINAGAGFIRQFVAMPLGMGYTVEGQLTGNEEFGGIQIIVYEPKPGRFPDRAPRASRYDATCGCLCEPAMEMGLAAGGRMRQQIYPDDYGRETWDPEQTGRVYVHIVNSLLYKKITGEEPPPSPIDAATYTACGYPWFDLYDEDKGDIAPTPELAGVKSVSEKDAEQGLPSGQDSTPLYIPPAQVVTLSADPTLVVDGVW
jgi:hypothetical protein